MLKAIVMLINSHSTMYHLYHQKTPEEVRAAQGIQKNAKAANKIGVDKEKLDELKREIEALQKLEIPPRSKLNA